MQEAAVILERTRRLLRWFHLIFNTEYSVLILNTQYFTEYSVLILNLYHFITAGLLEEVDQLNKELLKKQNELQECDECMQQVRNEIKKTETVLQEHPGAVYGGIDWLMICCTQRGSR